MQLSFRLGEVAESRIDENPLYLTSQLITYIGNKRRLSRLLSAGLSRAAEITGGGLFLDLFSGSGFVSRLARGFFSETISNDLEAYAETINRAYLCWEGDIIRDEYSRELSDLHRTIEESPREGFIRELYSPSDAMKIKDGERVFYTPENARYIDTASQIIREKGYKHSNQFIAGLIYKASKHVNTSGVFKGFYKDGKGKGAFGGAAGNALQRIMAPIKIPSIVLSDLKVKSRVLRCDAAEVSQDLNCDVAYLDPPYNQHPYGSNYFMLNLIDAYERPTEISRVSGIPREWNRSEFNVRASARAALEAVIEKSKARVLLVSYSSEGFISVEDMLEIGEATGVISVFDETYNIFRGCRNLRNRSKHLTEYLFLINRS